MRINFILTLNFSIDPEPFLLSNVHKKHFIPGQLDGLENSLQNTATWIALEMQFVYLFFYSSLLRAQFWKLH